MNVIIGDVRTRVRQTSWIKYEDGTFDFEVAILDAWGDQIHECEVSARDEHHAAEQAVERWKGRE